MFSKFKFIVLGILFSYDGSLAFAPLFISKFVNRVFYRVNNVNVFAVQSVLTHEIGLRDGLPSNSESEEVQTAREFVSDLKTKAACRSIISWTGKEKIALAVAKKVDFMCSETLSNCVWALGKLGIKRAHFPSLTFPSLLKSIDTNISWNQIELLRIVSGLHELQVEWSGEDYPASIKHSFLRLLSDDSGTSKFGHDSNTTPDHHNMEPLTARQFASVIYTCGRLGLRQDDLGPTDVDSILCLLQNHLPNMCLQGVANTLWGLSKIGLLWSELPDQFEEALSLQLATALTAPTFTREDPSSRGDKKPNSGVTSGSGTSAKSRDTYEKTDSRELTSILSSLSGMRTNWDSLSPSLQKNILSSLLNALPFLRDREVANSFWSLAQMQFSVVENTAKQSNESLSNLHSEFWVKFWERITSAAPSLSPFDLESIFSAIGI